MDPLLTADAITYRVSNIDADARAADLHEHLSRYGELISLRIVYDPKTSRSKGLAYATFAQYPQDLFDESDTDGYRESHLFMQRMLKITQTTAYDVPHDQIPSANESFQVEQMTLGSFVADQVFYSATTMDRQVEMVLEFSSFDRKIIWLWKGNDQCEYRFESNFSDMRGDLRIERDPADSHCVFLTMVLRQPPKLFRSGFDTVEEHGLWEWSRQYQQIWQRTTHFAKFPDADFGGNLAYRFRLSPIDTDRDEKDFRNKVVALTRVNLVDPAVDIHQVVRVQVIEEIPWKCVDILQDRSFELSFELRFLMQALVSHGLINKYLITPEFARAVQKLRPAVAEAVLELMHQEAEPIYNPVKTLEATLQRVPELHSKIKKLPDHCISIRKVIITPTRFLCMPVSIELGNRVLRHFEHSMDRFLRVAFTDENLTKHLDGLKISEEVVQRIHEVLKAGLPMTDRVYRFLAFSSSQLREHACWFYGESPNAEWDCERIRTWMGSFDHIRSVAKYAARLGQCFSSTTPIRLNDPVVQDIPDVERNGFCFSDGIGTMSLAVAKKIADVFQKELVPSAYQVRMGGFKGVLSLDMGLPQDQEIVRFRPSMKKFTAPMETLGVIRISQFAPAYLNHQIISLLSSPPMDIDAEVFMDLQVRMQKLLEDMFIKPAVALKVISQYAAESNTFKVMARMIRGGMSMTEEPFLANLIHLFQCSKMKEVKEKARVLVEEGAQLVGVLDETGTLQYGEIFVQYTDPSDTEGNGRKVVTGEVLMAKMPAVHPGDIRVLTCVDHEALRGYCDVVVFPQNGHRPHTHEASGSDLDGDVYFVTWNPNLIPVVQNFFPLEYEAPPPVIVESFVTMDDIKQFFVDYIRNDNLGLIATAHKVHADLSAKGVLSDKCIQLAKLHSLAVDFPKTGVPAKFDAQLYQVPTYPDFLHRFNRNSYESQKALGMMFRDVRCRQFRPTYEGIQADPMFLVDGLDKFLSEALLVKQNFDFDLTRLMHQYGIRSEFEVLTQMVMEFNKQNSRKEFEVKQRLNEIITDLSLQYQLVFWGVGDVRSRQFTPETLAKASAWYFVTYEWVNLHTIHRRKPAWNRSPLIGFPWMTICDSLVEIRRQRRMGVLPAFTGDVDSLRELLFRIPSHTTAQLNTERPVGDLDALMEELARLKEDLPHDEGVPVFPTFRSDFGRKVMRTLSSATQIIPPRSTRKFVARQFPLVNPRQRKPGFERTSLANDVRDEEEEAATNVATKDDACHGGRKSSQDSSSTYAGEGRMDSGFEELAATPSSQDDTEETIAGFAVLDLDEL